MKKRTVLFLCTLLCMICCAFGFSACDFGGEQSGADTEQSGGNSSNQKYTVTYDANGGTFANDSTIFEQKDIAANSTLTAPDSPIKAGYSFGGWATNKSGSEMWKFATDKVTKNITLYAVWEQESATVLSVDGASIDGTDIFMLVSPDTDSVSLSNKVVCTTDSVWRLYYDKLGQTEIPTKIAAGKTGGLANGDNVFYIVVTSSNDPQVNVYELTVHRSYAATVSYYNANALLKTQTVYTGDTFTANYTPSITGYTFNGWKTSANAKFTSSVLWKSLNLYADTTANTYTVTLDVNNGNEISGTEKTVTYDQSFSFTVPSRTGYSFVGWYIGSTQVTDERGKSVAAWTYTGNKTATAKWDVANITLSADGKTVTGLKNNVNNLIILNEYNGIEITSIGAEAFRDCSSLTSVTIPDSVTSIDYKAFYECSRLTSVTIGNGVTSIGDDAFNNCYRLTSVTIPDSVTSIGDSAFYGCSSLTGVYINDIAAWCGISFNGSYTNPLYYAKNLYLNNELVTKLTIPNSVTSIGDSAFENCSSLTSVTIPDSVTSIGYAAFFGCSSLTSVTIPDSVTSIGDSAFSGCSSLQYNVKDDLNYLGNNDNPYLYLAKTSNTDITTATIDSRCRFIGDSAFRDCSSLTSVTIPDSVTSIGRGAFYNCSSLTSVTIPNSVTSIGWSAFSGCSSLTSVTIGNSVTSIGDEAFLGCSRLTSVTIPDSVTSIGWLAFYNCSSLTSVTFENTSGWTAGSKSIASSSLANTSTAASYLTSTYKNYYWKRS